MNYHDIVKDDMRNGVGLRVTLFVSGCNHHCEGCHNPQTWNPESGIPFDESALEELKEKLNKDYIDGITFSGGDPLFPSNREEIRKIAEYVKSIGKTVWLYTGYNLRYNEEDDRFYFVNNSIERPEEFSLEWLNLIDVLVDGPFDIERLDQAYHWAGSTNQRVISVKKSLIAKKVVLFEENPRNSEDEVMYAPNEVTCNCGECS